MERPPQLTTHQIQTFVQDGVLVVENVLSEQDLSAALEGLRQTLASHQVDTTNLADTGHELRRLSSTNGSGGVLDIFYEGWKMKVAAHTQLFDITSDLWNAAYCHKGESHEELRDDEQFMWHPYGAFDCHKGYMYIDRIGYRLPTRLAEDLGTKLSGGGGSEDSSTTGNQKVNSKKTPIQRSLTPHLDCCPDALFSSDCKKWRPIQCFVALTGALEPDAGGFEAARAFHRTFGTWAAHRPQTVISQKNKRTANIGQKEGFLHVPPPCVGEYTHMRPTEDRDVMDRVQHVAVPAGSAVFWDNRYVRRNRFVAHGKEKRLTFKQFFAILASESHMPTRIDTVATIREPSCTAHFCLTFQSIDNTALGSSRTGGRGAIPPINGFARLFKVTSRTT